MDIPKNILLIEKPAGITSFGLVRQVRKKFEVKKAGHAGTLDPMATGLMIIGINEGTKGLKHYVGLDKIYEAEILLGVSTDTGDIEGRVTSSQKLNAQSLKEEEIKDVVEKIVGKWVLPVPIYSATKQGGEALYKKARRGAKIIIPNREMEIYQLKVQSIKFKEEKIFIEITLEVSSGTYVRSIAEEIGRRLGVPATLSRLRRTRIGEFDIKDAITI